MLDHVDFWRLALRSEVHTLRLTATRVASRLRPRPGEGLQDAAAWWRVVGRLETLERLLGERAAVGDSVELRNMLAQDVVVVAAWVRRGAAEVEGENA